MSDRIYKFDDRPFKPEPGAQTLGWDYEVRNSRRRVLWYGTCEYDLDKWRTDNPMRKSWEVRVRFFNEGWCCGCYRFAGDTYHERRENELAVRRHSATPEGKAEDRARFAAILGRVFGS